jgi:long-chain acyl-CoA synthetase
VARLLRVVPVDPDAGLVPALRAGAYGLRRGKILLLFPEGERSINGTPRAFKKGAAILATHLRIPIYPVALDGFFDVWPRGKPFQGRARLRIAFGEPVLPPAISTDPAAIYDRLIGDVRTRVVKMWEGLQAERMAFAAEIKRSH